MMRTHMRYADSPHVACQAVQTHAKKHGKTHVYNHADPKSYYFVNFSHFLHAFEQIGFFSHVYKGCRMLEKRM